MDAGGSCAHGIAREKSLRVRVEAQCCEGHRAGAAEVVKGRDARGRPAGPRGGRQGHDLRPRPWIACVVTALSRVDHDAALRALKADVRLGGGSRRHVEGHLLTPVRHAVRRIEQNESDRPGRRRLASAATVRGRERVGAVENEKRERKDECDDRERLSEQRVLPRRPRRLAAPKHLTLACSGLSRPSRVVG